MILYTEFFVIGARGNVQHVLDPVVSVRYLNFVPVDTVVFEAAIPVESKAKNVPIEAVFRSYVFHHKTGMQHAAADLVERHFIIRHGWRSLDKRDGISFRVAQLEMRRSTSIFGNCSRGHAMRQQVAVHSRYIVGGESN